MNFGHKLAYERVQILDDQYACSKLYTLNKRIKIQIY